MTPDAIPDPLPPGDERPMSHWLHKPASRQDVVTIPRLWVTLAASMIIHVAALFLLISRMQIISPDGQAVDQASARLQVRLAEANPAPPAREPPQVMRALPRPRAQAPKTPFRLPPSLAALPRLEAPAIRSPAFAALPPVVPPASPPQTTPPTQGDFLSYVQAKRRARGEAESAPAADESAELNSRIAANLPAAAHGVAAQYMKRGGGIFEIKRMAYDDAAFEFFGWNTDMGRRTPQLIEVRKGDNPDMRIAVVRRMIVIIREHEQADFVWKSGRHDRDFTLSARLTDNAALENFLLHDLFDDARDPQ